MTSILPHKEQLERPIHKTDELEQLFDSYSKKPEQRLIGIEHEKTTVIFGTQGTVLPYKKNPLSPSIESLFESLQKKGYSPVYEKNNLIGLTKDHYSVSLEPGGQIEFSGSPMSSSYEAIKQAEKHLDELLPTAKEQDIGFLGCGFVPFASLEQVPKIPKNRYALMRQYLPKQGSFGLDMMHRTCTTQVNLDYTSEHDALFKLRLANLLGPFVAAMFAASPLKEGQAQGYHHYRFQCWLDTDNKRCGILPFVHKKNAKFIDYIQWALLVPMFFIEQKGQLFDANGMTFADFLAHGFNGKKATFYDWELHLSTLFPDARLRSYIETRTADAGPLELVFALPCFWQGILYHEPVAQAVYDLLREFSYEDLMELRKKIIFTGLDSITKLGSIRTIAQKLFDYAKAGLIAQGAQKELEYLAPLQDYIVFSATDRILEAYKKHPTKEGLINELLLNF